MYDYIFNEILNIFAFFGQDTPIHYEEIEMIDIIHWHHSFHEN
jgi:hypothetical protein